jgi:hypothetical protein
LDFPRLFFLQQLVVVVDNVRYLISILRHILRVRLHDTQHNDIQHNDTNDYDIQLNKTQCDGIHHNDIQQNTIQHNDTNVNDIQLNKTQYDGIQHNDI